MSPEFKNRFFDQRYISVAPTNTAVRVVNSALNTLYTFGIDKDFTVLEKPQQILLSKPEPDTSLPVEEFLETEPIPLDSEGRFEVFLSHVIEVQEIPIIIPDACSMQITDDRGDIQWQWEFWRPTQGKDAMVKMGDVEKTYPISGYYLGRTAVLLDEVSNAYWQNMESKKVLHGRTVAERYPNSILAQDAEMFLAGWDKFEE